MRATGIIRKLDELGRVTLPKETRKVLNINEGDPVEFFTDGDNIILKKYTPGCHCCNETDNLTEVLGIKLCQKWIDEFNKYRQMVDDIRRDK